MSDDLKREIASLRSIIIDYVEKSEERSQKRRAENIQVLVALGIVGGLISIFAQGVLIQSEYTIFYVVIGVSSMMFLLIKTFLPSIQVQRQIQIESDRLYWFDTVFLQILYSVAVLASLALGIWIMLDQYEIQINNRVFQAITGSISAIIVVFYWRLVSRASKQRKKRNIELRTVIEELRELDIKGHLVNDPSLIEEGISIEETEPKLGDRLRPDLLARDSNGDPVVIELKARRAGMSGVNQLREYIDSYKKDYNIATVRGILIAPGIEETASEELEECGLEYIELHGD